MRLPISPLLHRFGCDMTVYHHEDAPCTYRGVLYPVQNCAVPTASPLGAVSTQRWVYFGSNPLAIGDTVRTDDGALSVVSCQPCGGFYRAVLLQH